MSTGEEDPIQTRDWLITNAPDQLVRYITPAIYRSFIMSAFGFQGEKDPDYDDDLINGNGNGWYDTGSLWLNTTSGHKKLWRCFDGSAGRADWRLIYPVTVPEPPFPFPIIGTAQFSASVNDPSEMVGLPDKPDGNPMDAGDVVLLKCVTDTTVNGPWVVDSGPWRRPAWFADGMTFYETPMVWLEFFYHLDPGQPSLNYMWAPLAPNEFPPFTVGTDQLDWANIDQDKDVTAGLLVENQGGIEVNGGDSATLDLTNTIAVLGLAVGTLPSISFTPTNTPPAKPWSIWIDIGGNLNITNNVNVTIPILTAATGKRVSTYQVGIAPYINASDNYRYVKICNLPPYSVLELVMIHITQAFGGPGGNAQLEIALVKPGSVPPANVDGMGNWGALSVDSFKAWPPGLTVQTGIQYWLAPDPGMDVYLRMQDSSGIANINQGQAWVTLQWMLCK